MGWAAQNKCLQEPRVYNGLAGPFGASVWAGVIVDRRDM
jgi:hypothetical protein